MFIHRIVTIVMALVLGPAWAAQHVHPTAPTSDPSAGTAALSADAVRQLLAGDGMGLATAAELNNYPGPKHVLELKDHLRLSPGQQREVEAIRHRMLTAAQALGRQVVDAERALDAAFAGGRISEAELAQRVGALAALHGELRAAHLRAHLVTRSVLSDEQVRTYYSHRR